MKKIESGVFKIYFRGHKEHQGHIGQNLSGVFFSDTRVVVKNARFYSSLVTITRSKHNCASHIRYNKLLDYSMTSYHQIQD